MASAFVGVGVTLTRKNNLGQAALILSGAQKLRCIDIENESDEIAYIHIYDVDSAKASRGVRALHVIPIGPRDVRLLGPDIVGRDYASGIVAAALNRLHGTEDYDTSQPGVHVVFGTKVN